MAKSRKFMHRAMLDYFRPSKLRIQCACGKQSPVFEEIFHDYTISMEEQARAWYEKHTGLREIKPTQRSAS